MTAAGEPDLRRAARSEAFAEAVFLAGAIALAGYLRLLAVGLRGTYLDFDESMYIVLGKDLISGNGYTLNGLPNATFPFGVPLIAGAFYRLAGARWALNLPTAILGALTVLPVYLIVRAVRDRAAGAVAAILYAGLPSLLFLVPYCPYSLRIYSGSEIIFAFFILSAAYVFLRLAREPKVRHGLALGFFAGAATEVRQDGIAYFLLFAALAWAAAAVRAKRVLPREAVQALLWAALVFALLVAPFYLWVHAVTDKWYSGPRFYKTFTMRAALDRVIEADDWSAATDEYFSPSPDNSEIETSYYGIAPYHRANIAAGREDLPASRVLASLRPRSLAAAWRLLWGDLLPRGTWVFALVGLIWIAWKRRWASVAMLAALVVPAAWVTLTLYVLGRFYVVPALAMLLVASLGFDACIKAAVALASRVVRVDSPRAAAALYLAVPLALSLVLASSTLARARTLRHDRSNFERALEDKTDAFVAAASPLVPPGSRVVAWAPSVEAYMPVTWLAYPSATPDRVVDYAAKRQADFLVVRDASGFFLGYSPDDVINAAGPSRVLFDRDLSAERFVILDMRPSGAPR
jgi:4-amino-4-deoxy-L-arabinose transferase-like glycosyltransferase